jgi:hypothetical protein
MDGHLLKDGHAERAEVLSDCFFILGNKSGAGTDELRGKAGVCSWKWGGKRGGGDWAGRSRGFDLEKQSLTRAGIRYAARVRRDIHFPLPGEAGKHAL